MVMKVRRYADGGKVELPGRETRKISATKLPPPKSGPKPKKLADGGKVTKPSPPRPQPPAPKPPPKDTIQTPKVGSTVDTLRNQRARQMRELGLKDGGKVKKRR